jgi:hypothetical protein
MELQQLVLHRCHSFLQLLLVVAQLALLVLDLKQLLQCQLRLSMQSLQVLLVATVVVGCGLSLLRLLLLLLLLRLLRPPLQLCDLVDGPPVEVLEPPVKSGTGLILPGRPLQLRDNEDLWILRQWLQSWRWRI